MIKIVALNYGQEETNEDEENVVTREAQETIAESEYIRAIKLKSEGDIDLCLYLLKELLQTQVLNENSKNNRNAKLWTIKYNCHKNIALILEERQEYMLALQHYISAILIDDTDVSTLYRFGQLSLKLNATDLAEYAFECCLSRNSAHWCAAEGILQVMNANHNIIGSYICARRLHLEKINSEDAAQTLKEITTLFRQNIEFLKSCGGCDVQLLPNESSAINFKSILQEAHTSKETEDTSISKMPDIRKFSIKEANWHSIGLFIVNVYSFLQETNHNMLFTFDLNDFIGTSSNAVSIDTANDLPDATFVNVEKTSLTDGESKYTFNCDEEIIDQQKMSTTEKSDVQSMYYDSDSNFKSDGFDANKAKPRRRCSDLHFLEQWGWHKNRRYASRKKNERDEIDNSLNGYLRKIFSKYTEIPVEDKWPFNTLPGTDISECNDCNIYLSENSFNLKTRNQFEKFTNGVKGQSLDLSQLIFKWLKYISLSWSMLMPDPIKAVYVDVFKIYMSHFSFSSWNQLTANNYEAVYRISIFYLELSAKNQTSDNDLWPNVFYQLLFNIGNCRIISANNFEIFHLKLVYLEYLMLNKENRYEECLSCLQKMHDILEQKPPSYTLHIPNLDNMCININNVKNLQLKYKRQIDINNIPKFFEEQSWEELTNIVIVNIEAGGSRYDSECWLKDFCTQTEILLQSFWNMASYENCLLWSEKFLHFAMSHYLQEAKTSHRCSLLAQIINFVTSYIEAIILNEGFHVVSALKKENLCRMVHNIIRILVYQFDGTFEKNSNHGRELNFKRPWVILHQLILREENDSSSTLHTKSNETQDVNELIPMSFFILFTAHEYLGKRQWCTDDNGEFLQYVLDAVVLNIKAPVYDVCRDIIYEYLEQVTYCLFKYPQKKARLRHLEDHEASQIQFNWTNAVQVFDLYRPEDLPEFNSYKLESITSDMEQLLMKIISLMPKEFDPSQSIHHVTMFIEGHLDSPPRDLTSFKLPYKIISLFYLLADFYFKNRDFGKAIKFYTLDLTVNPTRFDSWAGMALSKASKIETKLNGIDPISMDGIWEECEEVLRCFECCINLNRYQTLLWIEYGSFSYTIHSCFSRYIKSNSKTATEESISVINERKNKMLTIAYNCFSLANSLQNSTANNSEDNSDSNDEKWLCQYMLGKISEKRKEEPKVYLGHYLMAANYLYENNATYPIKINHNNPTMLSVEALEVFYRINAAIIKYLQNEYRIPRCTGDLFKKVLKSLSNSPFAYNKAKIDGNSLNILKGKTTSKIKPPTNYVLKRENDAVNLENKILTSDSFKNVENREHEEAKDKDKNLDPITKDCIQSSTSAVLVSSGSTSVISSDTSTVESETESDDSIAEYENSTNIKGEILSTDELKVIYRMVVQNIEECATRFPEHYKSIYRLIVHYMNSSADFRDLALSEQLLLGQYKTSLGNLVNGLFYDRKNNNLFNGIWRIPSSEIDRPGSFSAHLVKCVKVFIQLLFAIKNYTILVDLAMNLYRTPDLDKRYITEDARKDLCQQSINYTTEILRSILQRNMDKRNDMETLNLLIDIYKIHKKCVKYMNQKEPVFAELLIEVYKFFIQDKVECVPDNCNFLDLAIKLCVQEITAQKNIEKSLNTDSTPNTSDYIVTQTSETPNVIVPRVIHIPGLNSRAKFRGNATKPFASTVANLAGPNTMNILPTDLAKNLQFLQMFGNAAQLTGGDSQEFQKLFDRFYSNMFPNEGNICPATGLLPQNPSNNRENQGALNISNPMNLIFPYSAARTSTSETSNNSENNDNLLQPPPFLKQHSKTKLPNKNKAIFNPYSRQVQCESSQNASNDVVSSNKTDILSNHLNVLKAYSNLLHNTGLHKIDSDNRHPTTIAKKLKDHVPETSNSLTNVDAKDFTTFTMPRDTSRFAPPSQIGNQFTNQHVSKSATVKSPTKTLQEKLAERQKAYQFHENNFSPTSASAKDNFCNDVIVLD